MAKKLTETDISKIIRDLPISGIEKKKFIASLIEEHRNQNEFFQLLNLDLVKLSVFSRAALMGNLLLKEKYVNFEDCIEVVYTVGSEFALYPKTLLIYLISMMITEKEYGKRVITLETDEPDKIENVKTKALAYGYKYGNVAKINLAKKCRKVSQKEKR